MPDQMTTTGSLGGGGRKEEPMSAVDDAIEVLRQAMLDEGQDPGTVEAKLNAAKPRTVNPVGNLADLQRGGASLAPEGGEEIDPSSMTKAELQAELDSQGVEYPASATKADLVALFEE